MHFGEIPDDLLLGWTGESVGDIPFWAHKTESDRIGTHILPDHSPQRAQIHLERYNPEMQECLSQLGSSVPSHIMLN